MNRASSEPAVAPIADQLEAARFLSAMRAELSRVLLAPPDAAKALAISERKLWELTANGEIPVVRTGRLVRYRLESLREWAKCNEQRNALD